MKMGMWKNVAGCKVQGAGTTSNKKHTTLLVRDAGCGVWHLGHKDILGHAESSPRNTQHVTLFRGGTIYFDRQKTFPKPGSTPHNTHQFFGEGCGDAVYVFVAGKMNCELIAEAWGKSRYEMYFISKLTDADSEQLETQHWIEVANECEYIINRQKEQLSAEYEKIGKMLQSMIDKSKLFCNPKNFNN